MDDMTQICNLFQPRPAHFLQLLPLLINFWKETFPQKVVVRWPIIISFEEIRHAPLQTSVQRKWSQDIDHFKYCFITVGKLEGRGITLFKQLILIERRPLALQPLSKDPMLNV